jgi:hypothetical protein
VVGVYVSLDEKLDTLTTLVRSLVTDVDGIDDRLDAVIKLQRTMLTDQDSAWAQQRKMNKGKG